MTGCAVILKTTYLFAAFNALLLHSSLAYHFRLMTQIKNRALWEPRRLTSAYVTIL